jgi:mono/diheme cytochrome c family protein
MDEQEKKAYLDKYKKQKEKGVPFFPDIIFKDAVASFIVFLVLVALAYFVGAPVEARANPADTSYTPRPEWYFLFLFQMLKYFPGNLEVIGAMVLPGIFVLLLLALPFLDRNPKRHFSNRIFASSAALLVVLGIGTLTVLAVNEAPPPLAAIVVDKAASLYAANCANCHGDNIDVPPGTDLHKVIAAGTHEGMPSWGGDLSTDEIDALAGFILSPNGSSLFAKNCAICHKQPLLAAGNPIELQRVFDEAYDYPPHKGFQAANWKETLSESEMNALLNFLAAPDGQRLFTINCGGCHGRGVAYSGSEAELRQLISQGGQHLDMPAWRGTLSESDLSTLADYVVDPQTTGDGNTLFDQHCTACHGDRVPSVPDKTSALKIIGSGGAHITMPVWGDVLTPEQLDALVKYTLQSSKGTDLQTGAQLFAENCAACHGQHGQGGPNPGLAGDTIAPISSAEYLSTRDDETIRNIISQGQPDFGMSPFGDSYGGPLSSDQVDAILAFIRNWQENPPEITPQQPVEPQSTPGTPSGQSSFSTGVLPVLNAKCLVCHNSSTTLGGWNASDYDSVMSTGLNGPVVIPGDVSGSVLAGRILGTEGDLMPPAGSLPQAELDLFLEWIRSGAKND